MNEARRERIRELIRTLEAAQERVHAVWMEEEGAFDDRSPPSKETGAGSISENAVHYLEEATMEIQGAIECMQYAVGDDSPPEPPILPSSGGVYENHPKVRLMPFSGH